MFLKLKENHKNVFELLVREILILILKKYEPWNVLSFQNSS